MDLAFSFIPSPRDISTRGGLPRLLRLGTLFSTEAGKRCRRSGSLSCFVLIVVPPSPPGASRPWLPLVQGAPIRAAAIMRRRKLITLEEEKKKKRLSGGPNNPSFVRGHSNATKRKTRTSSEPIVWPSPPLPLLPMYRECINRASWLRSSTHGYAG